MKFRKTKSGFQTKLHKDVKKIKVSNELLVPVDKTTNFYKVQTKEYSKLLDDNITTKYEKAPPSLEKEIQAGERNIAGKLQLEDRINVSGKNKHL